MVDCVKQVKNAMGDKLSLDDIKAIVSELETQKRRIIANQKTVGKLGELDEQLYKQGMMIGNQAKLAAKLERRNRYINFLREKEIDKVIEAAIEASDNPMEGLRAPLVGSNFVFEGAGDSVGSRVTALSQEYGGALIAGLRQADLLVKFEKMSGEYERQVAKALANFNTPDPKSRADIKVTADAYNTAKIMFKVQREALRRLNKAGGFVGTLLGYVVRQSHDRSKMIRAGEEAWKAGIRDRLDYEKMGIEPDDIDRFLSSAWDAITTGIRLQQEVQPSDIGRAFTGPRNLAKKESESRLLEFKDSDAWYDYDQEFGIGSLSNAFMQDLSRSARSTALMQKLGTNPEAMVDRMVAKVRRKYREKYRGDRKKLRNLEEKFDTEMAELTGAVYQSESGWGSNLAADIGKGVRAVQTMSKLGGATISSISDVAALAVNRQYQGASMLDSWAEAFTAVFKGLQGGEVREMADLIGVGLDGQLGDFMSRFNASYDIPGKMTGMMQTFFKLNLLSQWTEANKRGATLLIARDLANNSSKEFADLPSDLQRLLSRYNIDASKWQAARSAVKQAADGREYLLPELIDDVDLKQSIHLLYITESDISVPTPGARERAMLNQGYRPGTYAGEAFRYITQFKSFSITMLSRVFGRQLAAKEYGGIANLIVGTTVLGYFSMQAKEFVKGREPRPPTMNTFVAAMLQGGGLGIYGDFLFGQANYYGGSTLETAVGPTIGTLAQFFDAVLKTRDVLLGDDIPLGADFLRLAKGNVPFANLFYTKMVLDYSVWYQLQEMQNPGYLRRMERRVKRENDQEYWAPPSERIKTGGGFR